jgi:hypothetical protein
VVIEDIAEDRKREASNASPAPATPAAARRRKTHFPKVDKAVATLKAAGRWVDNMRPAQAYRLVTSQLIEDGHGGDMPSRDTVLRYLDRLGW